MSRKLKAFILAAVVALTTLTVATPASATQYFNCPDGVGCIWVNDNGGGTRITVSVGSYGTDVCWNMTTSSALYNAGSSASADYGNGWDLVVYAFPGCSDGGQGLFGYQMVQTSHFENWGGTYFNDRSKSFMITHT